MTATATATERSQLLPLSPPLSPLISLSLPLAAPFSYSSQAQFKRLFALELCVNLHLHGAVNATQTRSRSKKFNAASPHLPPSPCAPCCTRLYVAQLTFNCKTNTKQSETKRKKRQKRKRMRKNAAEFISNFRVAFVVVVVAGYMI